MRIIISPAKKMNADTDSFPVRDLPRFLPEAEILLERLRAMTPEELKTLWKCNDSIAKLNIERLRDMDLRRGLTPAVMAYEGIQYRYMAPGVMTAGQLEYLHCRLRILSGFYGLLRPFDGVRPYRLEMQAKLRAVKDLYSFWGEKLSEQLASETDWILDLASREYGRAVAGVERTACVFGELRDGRVVEKGTMCKMARGQMVRWLAENGIEDREDVKGFKDLGYRFCRELSDSEKYVFIKGGA